MNNMSNIILGHHRNPVTKHQNVIAEKKWNVQWKGTIKLMMQFINMMLEEGEWECCFYNHKLSLTEEIFQYDNTF